MEIQTAFGFKELYTHIVGEMAKAVCERDGETGQQLTRAQVAAHMVMAFLPRDIIEAMLAGHCVMLHELMVDSVRDMLREAVGPARRGTRSAVLAMDKAFGRNLADLRRYQKREADGRRDVLETQPAEVPNETEIADRVRRHQTQAADQAARQSGRAAPAPVGEKQDVPAQSKAMAPGTSNVFHPSPAAISACIANPEAKAALDAGDPARFARAMGVNTPSTAYIAAATGPMRERNGQGKRDIEVRAIPASDETARAAAG